MKIAKIGLRITNNFMLVFFWQNTTSTRQDRFWFYGSNKIMSLLQDPPSTGLPAPSGQHTVQAQWAFRCGCRTFANGFVAVAVLVVDGEGGAHLLQRRLAQDDQRPYVHN